MKATLSQIEAFYWIARLGSFRGAADFLNLTQPTISLRIRASRRRWMHGCSSGRAGGRGSPARERHCYRVRIA